MRDFNVFEITEFIRGAFTLHTRAYNADKPINPKSNYGRLYKLAREGAARAESGPAPLVRLEPRDAEKKKALLQRRGDAVNVVDPGFVPPGAKEYVLLSIEGRCVDAPRGVKGQSFGGFPTLQLTGNCEKAQQKKFNETVVYIWQPEHGYLRPAHREPGRVLCIDARSISIFPVAKDSFWNLAPQMITCKPDRPSQQWAHDPQTGNMRNPITGLCMAADQASFCQQRARRVVCRVARWIKQRRCAVQLREPHAGVLICAPYPAYDLCTCRSYPLTRAPLACALPSVCSAAREWEAGPQAVRKKVHPARQVDPI